MDLLKQSINNSESMSFAFPINTFFTLYNINNQQKNQIEPIKENLIEPIKENLIKENLNPIEFIKENIKIGNNDNIIKNMIFKELSNPIFNKKFTKKDISLIQNGLITNKWNISLCKFISFIFDISFIYRKNNIIDNDIVNLKIENYKL